MNYKIKKALAVTGIILAASVSLGACSLGNNTQAETTTAAVSTTETSVSTEEIAELFTERDLDPSYDDATAVHIALADSGITSDSTDGLTINGSTVTITAEGVYVLSGSLSNGQIIVEAQDTDKVQIVLNSVNISSSSTAAIYVKQADKVFVTTAEGTENTLSESGAFAADGDTNVDAVVFSKSDITFCGEGTLTVTTENGNVITSKDDLKMTLGTYNITVSGKGLEANDSIRIADGTYNIQSEDDALHSDDYTTVIGGVFTIASGDDGIHSDGATTINGGSFNITESYEGIEGQTITITGGEISMKTSDDGLNAAGGNDQSGVGGQMDTFAADMNAMIEISGGKLYINSEGDGIDSNGSITISGGEITVDGPTNAGNGAMDYNGTASVTGGTIVAAGAAGMAENFSEATQGAILVNLSQTANGGTVKVTDSDGNTVITAEISKSFGNVVVSSPDLQKGETYTVSVGSDSQTVTLDDYVYGSGSGMGMGMGGMQGGPGGMQGATGEMPEGEMPSGEYGMHGGPRG